MQNPWVHDDEEVSTKTSQIHESRANMLAALVWTALLVLFAAIVLFAGDQLTMPSPDRALSMLLSVFGVVLFVLFALPVLFKLLRISRLLTALVVVGSLGLGGRLLLTNGSLFSEEYRLLTELAGSELQATMELFEALSLLV